MFEGRLTRDHLLVKFTEMRQAAIGQQRQLRLQGENLRSVNCSFQRGAS